MLSAFGLGLGFEHFPCPPPHPRWVVVFLLIYKIFWYIKSARPLSYKLQIFFSQSVWRLLSLLTILFEVLKIWFFYSNEPILYLFSSELVSCWERLSPFHSHKMSSSFLSSIFYEFIFSVEILVPSGICLDVKSEDKIQFYFFFQMASSYFQHPLLNNPFFA